jgi:sugar-specific transcriptional regulator TrmB
MNVYSLLERLQEKGLISFALTGKRKFYEAASPKTLLAIEEERKDKIEQLIPQLNAQMNLSSVTQEAMIYKDKNGIKSALDEVTRAKTEVYIFASGWGFQKNFSDYYDVWHSRLVKNKIKGKMLLGNKFRDLKIQKPWVYKYLPSDFIFPSTTVVYDDKVLLNLWGTPPLGILIKGKEVSESYKRYFELLWKQAKN